MRNSFFLGSGTAVAELSVDPGEVFGVAFGNCYCALTMPIRLELRAPAGSGRWFYFKELCCRLSVFDGAYCTESRIVQLLMKVEGGKSLEDRIAHLEFPFDQHRLQMIEKLRAGDDCKLRLDCDLLVDEMVAVGSHVNFGREVPHLALVESHKVFSQVRTHIARTHWGERILPGLQFGMVYFAELPIIPLESVERFSVAFRALKDAQRFHREGRYGETVGKTRLALEQMTEPEEYLDENNVRRYRPVLKRAWQSRLGEATYTWINECVKALKRPANDAVHGSRGNFSQFESQMLLMVATTVIAYAAEHGLD